MRRLLILLCFLTVTAVAWACGDKLVLMMGARSSLIKPGHAAMILAYPGQTASAALVRDLQFQAALKKAGHRIQVVEDTAGLDTALMRGKYDLVMTDITNANEVSQRVLSATPKPVLLPVAFRAAKEEQSAFQKKYH